jgi:hypothetical protein
MRSRPILKGSAAPIRESTGEYFLALGQEQPDREYSGAYQTKVGWAG